MGEQQNNLKCENPSTKVNGIPSRFFCDEYSLKKPLNNEWSIINLIEYLKNRLNLEENMEIDQFVSGTNDFSEFQLDNNKMEEHDYFDKFFTLTLKNEGVSFLENKNG